jgi:hypothetical protein
MCRKPVKLPPRRLRETFAGVTFGPRNLSPWRPFEVRISDHRREL